MTRINFAPIETPEQQALATKIIAERGSLLDLYRVLLHSPPLASGWLHYLTAIRHESTLSAALRELVILRIAILNRASYEAEQHTPIARKAGVSDEKIAALAAWQQSRAFDELERAVLGYADAMTLDIKVPDELFNLVNCQLGARLTIELTATIAAYNMVSRFLEALEIHATS